VLRTKTWVGALGLLICATAAIAEHGGPADQAAQLVDLPASDLGTALAYLAQRYNVDLIYDPSLIKGINVPRLGGYMTAREALAELVKPSGLSIIENRPGSYLITQAQDSIKKPAEVSPPGFGPLQKNTLTPIIEAPLNEVVVVGTHLSNEIPVGASISVYGAQDLELAGGVSLDNLGRKMTANFTGADSLSTLNTNGNVGNLRQGASSNVFGGAGFNLLGLGPGATLTLLNGHRLAPAGLDGSITDISLIPLSAIDHIEVLTDGASAVYGSDAVAGVVNIVTRSSLEGAETVGRFGRSTQGGGGQSMGAQLFGHPGGPAMPWSILNTAIRKPWTLHSEIGYRLKRPPIRWSRRISSAVSMYLANNNCPRILICRLRVSIRAARSPLMAWRSRRMVPLRESKLPVEP
jgi:iron complex outermembrane receptor protein